MRAPPRYSEALLLFSETSAMRSLLLGELPARHRRAGTRLDVRSLRPDQALPPLEEAPVLAVVVSQATPPELEHVAPWLTALRPVVAAFGAPGGRMQGRGAVTLFTGNAVPRPTTWVLGHHKIGIDGWLAEPV